MRSARLGSSSSFCGAVCTAASIGTLVISDSTSQDTMISLYRIVSLVMGAPGSNPVQVLLLLFFFLFATTSPGTE